MAYHANMMFFEFMQDGRYKVLVHIDSWTKYRESMWFSTRRKRPKDSTFRFYVEPISTRANRRRIYIKPKLKPTPWWMKKGDTKPAFSIFKNRLLEFGNRFSWNTSTNLIDDVTSHCRCNVTTFFRDYPVINQIQPEANMSPAPVVSTTTVSTGLIWISLHLYQQERLSHRVSQPLLHQIPWFSSLFLQEIGRKEA